MADRDRKTPLPPPYGPRKTPVPHTDYAGVEVRNRRFAEGSGVPEEIGHEDTGVLALQFHGAMAASGHNPEEIVDRLATKMVEKMGGGGGSPKKSSDLQGWLKFALTLIVAVLTGWWVLSEKLGERPTEEKVNAEIIERVAPVAAQTNQNTHELREQRDAIIETRGAIKNIGEAIGEMKGDLKELKKKRR